MDTFSSRSDGSASTAKSAWGAVLPHVQRLLFGPDSPIARESSLFTRFKEFIEAYAKKRSNAATAFKEKSRVKHVFDFPPFHPMLRIPFRLRGYTWPELKERIECIPGFWEQSPHLTKEKVQELSNLMHYFFQYLQKQKFQEMWSTREKQKTLPIYKFKQEIIETVQDNPVTIIAGDTGCGKSTQVPQYLLEAGFKRLACTQPRRLACIALASRVQYETFHQFGDEIGYQIRFEKRASSATRLLFLTEGILLRQLPSMTEAAAEVSKTPRMLGEVREKEDPSENHYDVIILDEVHERHLFADFLLGILKCLLATNPEVKLVLMSATINTELFREYFHGAAPVVSVPGFAYPVEVMYRAPTILDRLQQQSAPRQRINPEPYVQVMREIDMKYSGPKFQRGDLLIFVSGIREIEIISQAARDYAESRGVGSVANSGGATSKTSAKVPLSAKGELESDPLEGSTCKWIILQLHSTLSQDEQGRVFLQPPPGHRKCIVTTNIAETSITIDGIRFVVDSGKVKEMSYDTDTKMSRLKEFDISRASAEQRKGRAGRTGPGKCIRLYSEKHYNEEMEPFPVPEIQRVNLDSMVLQLLSLGVGDPSSFPFVEPPRSDALEASVVNLQAIGAIESNNSGLTPLGLLLAQLPVDVMIGKMLVQGCLLNDRNVDCVLTLAALLTVQSPLTNKAIVSYRPGSTAIEKRSTSSFRPVEFELTSDHGDVFTLLKIYAEWLSVKDQQGSSRVWCRTRGIEEQRLYEVTKLRAQFRTLLEDAHLIADDTDVIQSASERSLRHGELKRLKQLKRKKEEEDRSEGSSRKRWKKSGKHSLLRNFDADEGDLEDDDGEPDLRDVDFRIRFGGSDLSASLDRLSLGSMTELIVVKCLLASSLYPNVAAPDRFNTYNPGDPCLFHATSMPGCSFHPTSAFSALPDCLNPSEEEPEERAFQEEVKSSKHQLIVFTHILETTAKYLINPFRVPVLQTLMLFARRIDTNSELSRFVFDEWILIRFSEPKTGLQAFVWGLKLREVMSEIIRLRLESALQQPSTSSASTSRERRRGALSHEFNDKEDVSEKLRKLKKSVMRRILEYHYEPYTYSVKRLLKADLSSLYRPGNSASSSGCDSMNSTMSSKERKPNFNFGYDVLRAYPDDPPLELDFLCVTCGEEMGDDPPVSERLAHMLQCLWSEQDQKEVKRKRDERKASSGERDRGWFCVECQERIVGLSTTGILRHKADHRRTQK